MKKFIERHTDGVSYENDFKLYFQQKISGDLTSWLERLRNEFEKWNLGGVLNTLMFNFGYTRIYNTENDTYNYLYYCNQLSYGWYQYTMHGGKEVTLQIADKTIVTIGKFKADRVGSYALVSAIQLALILRDKKALNFYAEIPLSFTSQQDQDDIIGEGCMNFYQELIKNKSKEVLLTSKKINEYLDWKEYKKYVKEEGFNSLGVWEIILSIRTPMVKGFILPVLAIYEAVFQKDEAEYEDAVYEALLKWKEYYTMKYIDRHGEEIDHSTESAGYLALPIIAACAYAHDRGMVLKTVESDYLCDWMIRGDFEGFELMVKD